MPLHAFALKKNLAGIGPVSRTRDNEHTAASLGQSKELGIEDPPRDISFGTKHETSVRPFAPWSDERHIFAGKSCQETAECVVLGVEDSGHVLPEYERRVEVVGHFAKDEGQVPASIVKRLP